MSSSGSQFLEDDHPEVSIDAGSDNDEAVEFHMPHSPAIDEKLNSEATDQQKDFDSDDEKIAGNSQTWRDQPLYDVDGDGGGSWDAFFSGDDVRRINLRSASDVEDDAQDEEERLRQRREKCYRSMSPVSASIFRPSPDQGVATLPVKKAVCYGVCFTDEAESLTLLKCGKCPALMETFSYGHHMRFRHEGEMAPANPPTAEANNNDGEETLSENDCQDFLLSPLHVYEDNDPTTLQEGQSIDTPSTSQAVVQPPAEPKAADSVYYVVEKQDDLKIVVKRSPQKTATSEKAKKRSKKEENSTKKVKFELSETSPPNSPKSSKSDKRKRAGTRKTKKTDDDQEDKADTTPTFKQPKQRRVGGGPSTSAVVLSRASAASRAGGEEVAGPSGNPLADQPNVSQVALEEEEQRLILEEGTRRAASVQLRALSAQYSNEAAAHSCFRIAAQFPPAGSAPPSVRSSASSAAAMLQRRLSSSTLQFASTSSTMVYDEKPLPNGNDNYAHAYDRKKVSTHSTKLVPVNSPTFLTTEEAPSHCTTGRINIDMLNYAEFPKRNGHVNDGAEPMLPSSLQPHHYPQPSMGRLLPHHQAVGHHHQLQQQSSHSQFAHGRLAAVKPVMRHQYHSYPTTSQHSQHQQPIENFGNNELALSNSMDSNENGAYLDNVGVKSGSRGGPANQQIDNAELRHQEQMMLRAAQVIGTNPTGIAHLRGNAQKRLYYVGGGDREPTDPNGNGPSFNSPSHHLIKKFRPIMPRVNSTVANVNIANNADVRHDQYNSPNYQLLANRPRYVDAQVGESGHRPTFSSVATAVPSKLALGGGLTVGVGMRPIAPKTYPARVPTFHPVLPKRMVPGTIGNLTPNFTVRYGSSKVMNIDEPNRSSFTHLRYATGHHVIDAGDVTAAEKPTTFATTANGRIACRVYASSKGFVTQPQPVSYEFEKKRYLPTVTSSSSSGHPIFIHAKAVATENNLHLQNIEPPPVLEAEGRINTNMTNDNSHFPSIGDDNLF